MSTLLNLKHKKVLIVGATAGIIGPLASMLESENAELYCTGRDINKLKSKYSHLSEERIIQIDLNNVSKAICEDLPQFDGVVFAAGLMQQKPFKFSSQNDLISTFQVNFFSQIELLRLLYSSQKLKLNCSVIFISSIAPFKSFVGVVGYTASKGAINAAVKSLSIELGKRNKVRVNAICPAMVKTDIFQESENLVGSEAMTEHLKSYILGEISPEDVCGAVTFLLSDLSKKITGQSLIVDSGFLC